MNFGTPPIGPSLTPFAGVIPNVIALPYGRTLPFYIKAPSWRNLLKLMARLSGTHLEPTMEAIAVVKSEMKLRIVVSFVKVCAHILLSRSPILRVYCDAGPSGVERLAYSSLHDH